MRVGSDQYMRTPVERLALIGVLRWSANKRTPRRFNSCTTRLSMFKPSQQTLPSLSGSLRIGRKTDRRISRHKEERRLFAQQLFNRLMFIALIQKKGWLQLNDRSDYLDALWDDYRDQKGKLSEASFYRQRLCPLFFQGLNNIGDAPSR